MTRRALLVGLAGLLLLLLAPAAHAHEAEEEVPARALVRQAIALIRTQPEQVEAILDKMADALQAEDTEGVDLALVERAQAAFRAGDLHRAQDLLEEAIGARPHGSVGATGEEAGEAPGETGAAGLHERALEGTAGRWANTPEALLLAVAGVLAAAGLVVSWRMR